MEHNLSPRYPVPLTLVRRPKNRRDRIVHIDRYTAQDLRQYQERLKAWLGPRTAESFFFINAYGKPLSRNALSTYFLKYHAPRFRERWNKAVTLYSLRHSSATDWLDAAARQRRDALPFVQRQLGHESLDSTAVYTHVAIEPLRQMFRQYHPRDTRLASQQKIPTSAGALEKRWDSQRKPPPPEPELH